MRYQQARKDIRSWLTNDQNKDARFTTFFDLYGLPGDFPGFLKVKQTTDPYVKVKILEDALGEDIADCRFIPYFQLHEFEALLLAEPRKFETQFPNSAKGIQNLVSVMSQFPNPELVNDSPNAAPSKRIISEIPEYGKRKASAGPLLAEKIGLPFLKSRCKHFSEWISQLEGLAQKPLDSPPVCY